MVVNPARHEAIRLVGYTLIMSRRHMFQAAFLAAIIPGLSGCDRPGSSPPVNPTSTRTVEAGCGQCLFGLPGGGCTLAVRFEGKAYYVTGSSIDDHGDAHAADGLCNAIRPAEATGEVTNDLFVADRIALIPAPRMEINPQRHHSASTRVAPTVHKAFERPPALHQAS